MNERNQERLGWQTALEHHEELCSERGRTLDVRFDAVDTKFESVDKRFDAVDRRFESVEKRLDNIEQLQRFTLGAILAWPPLLTAVLKLLP